ncbi:M60 family metallopeptidase [Thalassotalea sp. 1_MG-2023]|uniref:M60 family metallopeptidase n=1 Tax=Thalassotalea sp. 1_MG-2023 TaxID=3062680 RepID=UPI0026E18EA7|nr:M60 family metallopeptidase [Thalassotalea sp. 1_MG-2023]MDO6426927.1 M60 family metallopeptidase [Thalassotalea sp. 1_MG-2023]
MKITKNKISLALMMCTSVVGGFLIGCGSGGSSESKQETITEDVVEVPDNTEEPEQSTLSFEKQFIVTAADPNLCIDTTGDNKVTLTGCQNTKPSQLWRYDLADKLLVNESTDKCVTTIDSALALNTCQSSANQLWVFEDNIFSQDGHSFDVNMSELSLIVYATHGGINQQWFVPSVAAASIDESYVSNFPISRSNKSAYTMEQTMDIINRRTPIDEALPFPRDVSEFPGNVSADKPRITKQVTFNRYFYEDTTSDTLDRQHWINTGTYAVAGEIIEIDVTAEENVDELYAIINVHTDALGLNSANVVADNSVKRFPSVSTKIRLHNGKNQLRSQYGGQVVIASNKSDDSDVTINVSNVVETTYFKLGRDSFSDWLSIRDKSAPWGVLEGEHAVLDLSKAELQKVDDPEQLLKTFDQTVTLVRDLAGFEDDATGVHKMPTLKERFVSDVQITAGFAHAGFPIMASPGWNLYSLDTAQNNGWGNWHETGHNYQQFCLWSSPFGTESTVNLFSLYVQENVNQPSRIQIENRYSNAINKLNDNFSFTNNADVWDKLVFLMQIKHALPDIGWDMFRQLNRRFREMDTAQQASVCQSDEASFSMTFELLSDITGYDLTTHFKTWGVNVSEASYQKIADKNLPQPPVDISRVNPQ